LTVKLSVEHISKSFEALDKGKENIPILDDISFEVNEGEIISIMGPTGCGKTTLLRIIDGLVQADAGEIKVDGTPVGPTGKNPFATVFQHFNLLPWRSAIKNVELGLEAKEVPKEERQKIAEQFLELVGLKGYETYHPHQLSGGMQQRVGLARALAVNPQVILFDEPFSSVDLLLRESLQDEVLKILYKTKKTAVFVTHNVEEAVSLSDRIISLATRPGRIKKIYDVKLPRPRDADTLLSSEGAAMLKTLRKDLRETMLSSPASELPLSGAPAPDSED
jgi:NitT/TauT family transport system ATP-binding protein